MYGLLLESLAEHIKVVYGEEKWEEVRKKAGVEQTTFSTHNVYPENIVQKLTKTASEVLGITDREFMSNQGHFFVDFVGQYGYDRVLSVLGRHMRDFLNGLDNLHEYLKFSYPRMKAPSFFVENESSTGLTLQYRSKRRGFNYYTMGQIRQVGKLFYQTDVQIELIKEECIMDLNVVTFQLTFDNRAYCETATLARDDSQLNIKSSVFMDIFPFCIIFGSDMTIKSIGNSLAHILPQVVGQKISDVFNLSRPLIEFKFSAVLKKTNNIFEIETNTEAIAPSTGRHVDLHTADSETADFTSKITLKGQMLYMEEWRMIIFLGTPIMADLDAMISSGLYINDLSMHDFSRDLMMAGTQQSVELKLALDQEKQKAQKLEQSMKKLDEEMKRTDELLYQMIPKTCADRLRKGENPVDTCQVFECVTILFSDVVTFTEICSRISPMEVVSMLNAMYSLFDRLTELNGVYKVETIGDAYMVVGGAPVIDELHASRICDMALDMLDAIQDLTDPSTGNHLRIRVGVHSGTVVAGIVGLKMPRYCLFGDSVNTASRMESTSEAMRVHVSQTTRELLSSNYLISERGEIAVKGKGNMKTYWLNGKSDRQPSARSGRLSVVKASSEASSIIRGYSPVTLDDIKKTSVTSSPAHSCKSALSLSPGSGFPLINNRQSGPTANAHNDSFDRSSSTCPVQCSPPIAPLDGTPHTTTSSQSVHNDRSVSRNDQIPVSPKVDMQLIMTCPHGVAMELTPSTLRGMSRKVALSSVLTSRPPSTPAPWKPPGCPLSRGLKVGVLPDITVAHHNDIGSLHHHPMSPLDSNTGQLLEAKTADAAPAAGDMTSVCCPGFGGRRNISTKNPTSPICLLL